MTIQSLQSPPARSAPVIDENEAPFRQLWSAWFRRVFTTFNANASMMQSAYSGTITTAKLTTGGANGSMTFVNGVLTAQTPAS